MHPWMQESEVTDPQVRAPRMSRRGGWWGIGFVAAVVVALESGWLLRALGLVVAGLTLARAAASLVAPTILDTVAPIAFLAFVLAVSLHMLFTPPGQRAV